MGFPDCSPYRLGNDNINERDRMFKDPKAFLNEGLE